MCSTEESFSKTNRLWTSLTKLKSGWREGHPSLINRIAEKESVSKFTFRKLFNLASRIPIWIARTSASTTEQAPKAEAKPRMKLPLKSLRTPPADATSPWLPTTPSQLKFYRPHIRSNPLVEIRRGSTSRKATFLVVNEALLKGQSLEPSLQTDVPRRSSLSLKNTLISSLPNATCGSPKKSFPINSSLTSTHL